MNRYRPMKESNSYEADVTPSSFTVNKRPLALFNNPRLVTQRVFIVMKSVVQHGNTESNDSSEECLQ